MARNLLTNSPSQLHKPGAKINILVKLQGSLHELLRGCKKTQSFIITTPLQDLRTVSVLTDKGTSDTITKNARRPSALIRSSKGHALW